MIHAYGDISPEIDKVAFIAPIVAIIGDVRFGNNTSVWFNATIRGDFSSISIGDFSNIQDNCVVHVSHGLPVRIGNYVSIGHGAIVHSATVQDNCIIGMGAVLLDGSIIGQNCIVAAQSVVPPGKIYPDGSMIMGSPAKVTRQLTEQEIAGIRENAVNYYNLALQSKLDYSAID